jgi:hypothetical protein
MHLASPNRTAQWMPGLRKFLDTLNSLPSFITKLVAQAHALCVVIANCIDKFPASREQEPYPQARFPNSAKTCSASTAPSSPEW